MRVSPFRHLRIDGYMPLPAAFRSLSRLSSASSAKAFTLCPLLLDPAVFPLALGFLLPVSPVFSFPGARSFTPFLFPGYFRFGCYFYLYGIFKVHLLPPVLRQMEMERFELLTPCLQGRCSPN